MTKLEELRALCDRIGMKGSRNYSSNCLYNALRRGGINSVEQLVTTPINELVKIRDLGEKKVSYIISKLLAESENKKEGES